MGYIRGKWELDGGELAGELTGYPVKQEEIYPETWEKQRSHWYGDSASLSPCKCSLPIGLILAERNAWGKLLSSVLFEQSIPGLQLSKENISVSAHSDASVLQVIYLYLGNSYCHHLLPNLEEWKELVEATVRIGCQPVILLPPLREAVMEKILEERIGPLVLWWKDNLSGFIDTYGYVGDNSLEIVVNDWGMVEACGRFPGVSITLGNHLNKYRKDVRLPWRHYDEKEYRLLRESAGLPKEYLSWLQKNHRVKGISWEVCGYVPELTGPVVDEDREVMDTHGAWDKDDKTWDKEVIAMEHTLYLPMMSMNTGGHCTLRAVCESGDRGHQRYAEVCPGYCRDHAFLYPDFLGMVGRCHPLWGYDPEILTSDEYLQEWIRQGITRIVWNGV